MRVMACALLGVFGIAAIAIADNPTLFGPAPGGPPIEGGRDVCWSQPGDPAQSLGSSEVIGEYGVVSELANDFIFPEDTTVILARWWGGYWNGETGDENFRMNLRFYADGGCVPTEVIAEWMNLDANQTSFGSNFYVYEHAVSFPALGETRYWFVAQASDHPFPPQWGRLLTWPIEECGSMFRSAYFAYPDWSDSNDVFEPFEASQEFECEVVTAAVPTSWGAVKGLYR